MPPDSTWSNPFKKAEIELSSAQIDFKNFMNECLMGTEIFKKDENENEKCLRLDPSFVMDVRHRMVHQSKKILPSPQELVHAEALKLLRRENREKNLKLKEGRMVENEIFKLKQMLENHKLFAKKKINENIQPRPLSNKQKFPKHKKLWKKLECFDEPYNLQTWQSQSVKTAVESQSNHSIIVCDLRVPVKRKEYLEEFSVPENSIVENEIQHKNQTSEKEGKNEILERFLNKKEIQGKQELHCRVTEPEKIKEIPQIEDLINQKRIKHAWSTWKAYIQKVKIRKKEKTIYQNKIETFLIKLKEKKMREEKLTQLRGDICLKHQIKANFTQENRAKKLERLVKVKEKEERIKNLMKEIKTSQLEANEKLKEIRQRGLRNHENVEFLKRIEERRAERLKRRKEIEEIKRKRGEERETAQREKEEEQKRQEEECKRKKLKEIKEKRRLEKEKKEEQRKEREKLKLAEIHCEKYLLNSYGLRPWKTLIKIKDLQNQKALEFFESRLKQKVFQNWASMAQEKMAIELMRADALYGKILKRKYFFIWVQFYKEKIKQNQVAEDWNEFKIIERAFKRWLHFVQNERIDYLDKKYAAELNYERRLKLKYLTKLKDYPELKKLEQAKENRKRKWRQKVKEILPDYRPIDIADRILA